MTRKDLIEKYNIFGRNENISLHHKKGEFNFGGGYCGNISLINGNAMFNGKKYSDIQTLDTALREWEKSLDFPVDTYNPTYNEIYRIKYRIEWYLTEKMGFEVSYGTISSWDEKYVRKIGTDAKFVVNLEYSDDVVVIFMRIGEYSMTHEVKNAESGIAAINSILSGFVLMMAKDIVEVISSCDGSVAAEVDAFVRSNSNIFGYEKVDFKELMIEKLELQLKALKNM